MPSSVKSTKTAKKLKPLAPNRLPEPSELHHPFAFNKDKSDPSPSCPNRCEI